MRRRIKRKYPLGHTLSTLLAGREEPPLYPVPQKPEISPPRENPINLPQGPKHEAPAQKPETPAKKSSPAPAKEPPPIVPPSASAA